MIFNTDLLILKKSLKRRNTQSLIIHTCGLKKTKTNQKEIGRNGKKWREIVRNRKKQGRNKEDRGKPGKSTESL